MDYRFTALTIGVVLAATAGIRWTEHVRSAATRPLQAAAWEPATRVSSEPAATTSLIQQAVRQVNGQKSISAQVRHRTEMFDQKLVGSGTYHQMQSDKGLLVRFSLSVREKDRTISLLQVCDGRFLWSRDDTEEKPRLGRIDLQRLRAAAAAGRIKAGATPLLLPGGGLGQLLASLDLEFDFGTPREMQFQDVPLWVLAGRWKPERLMAHVGARNDLLDTQGRINSDVLPAQLPDRVLLVLGRDDLFPYHIDFRRAEPGHGVADDDLAWQRESRSLVTMELFEVEYGADLDPLLFVYEPGDAEPDDGTDEYVSKLEKR
jgi:hypothetical protein